MHFVRAALEASKTSSFLTKTKQEVGWALRVLWVVGVLGVLGALRA